MMALVRSSVPPLLDAMYPGGYLSYATFAGIDDEVMHMLTLASRVRAPAVDEIRQFNPETGSLVDSVTRMKMAKVCVCCLHRGGLFCHVGC
jgi:hypothetical protein